MITVKVSISMASSRLRPRSLLLFFTIAIILAIAQTSIATLSLNEYILNSGKPTYTVLSSANTIFGGKFYLLNVKSQTWRGIEWNHKVGIYVPRRLVYKNHGVLMVTGSAPKDPVSNINNYALVIESIGAPFIILWDIPNQPIFGLREDALIAYTLAKYLETGEENWPLLFPMVKGVISTMDCVQNLLEKEQNFRIEKFLVTGASKRGWTTYLTAAIDPRVFAIAPIVYDNLNMPLQMKKQLEYYGTFSEQIKDYTKYGLTKMIAETDPNKVPEIVKAIDPFYYKESLTMPKLIVIGTNDPYWVVDSSQLYFYDLPAPVYAYVIPNEVHNITNQAEFFNTLRAFFVLAVANSLPEIQWKENESGMIVETPEELEYAKGWYAVSDTLDFRKARWESIDLEVQLNECGKKIVKFEKNTDKNLAMLVELRILKEGYSFSLTTIPKVFKRKGN